LFFNFNKGKIMSVVSVLLVVLLVMFVGGLPTWPHSRNWGYYPTGVLGVALVVLIVLMLVGRI